MSDSIFENEVRPFLFDGLTEDQAEPELTLLVGQTGAGRSRAIGRLVTPAPGGELVLRAADLTPFLHPGDGAEPVREWMRDALRYAREHRISVILEDAFRTADDARAALEPFARAGYRTRVVAIAVPRAESLLAATARTVRQGRPVPGDVASEIDNGLQAIADLLPALPRETAVSVFRRDGAPVAVATADEALRAWDDARSQSLPGRVAAEWISELRRLTEAVTASPARASESSRAGLIALHQIALAEVIPGLPLPADSDARERLGARIEKDLDALARAVQTSAETTPASQQPTPEGRGI